MQIQDDNFAGSATGPEAIKQLGVVAKEKEKTRRLLLIVACLLIVLGGIGIVVAPKDKEVASYIIGSIMGVFALGAIGAASFKIKAPGVEISKNTLDRGSSTENHLTAES